MIVSRANKLYKEKIPLLSKIPKPPAKRLIYTAGLSGTGTTLLTRMFLNIPGVTVLPNEHFFWQFPSRMHDYPGTIIAAKGNPIGWLRRPKYPEHDREPPQKVKRDIIQNSAEHVDTVVVIRDVRSWMKSRARRESEWVAYMDELTENWHHVTACVKFEDLVTKPDATMRRVAALLKLDVPDDRPFSAYPDFVPDEFTRKDVDLAGHKPRPLDPVVLEHKVTTVQPETAERLRAFGYKVETQTDG